MSYILNHMTIQCIGNAIRGSKVIGKDAWKAVKYNLSLSQQTAQSVQHAKLKDSYAKKLMHSIRRNTPSVLVASACLLQHYDFENEGISLEALERYWKDNNIDTLHGLLKTTLICPICGKRIVLNNRVPDTEYCECKASPSASPDGWQPFLERENILVWRRPDESHPSLYSYRVYGNLPDVSVAAFVETQLNCSNRTSWDPTVIDLSVVESDGEHQDLLHWLVRFPRFFANREYIFKRRYHAYPERGELVIVSECCDEGVKGVAPPSKGVHRVETYWSVMVVRAVGGPDPTKPGMEYMLTYFDNPGTSLPAAITNFVAYTGFPNFLANLSKASLSVQKKFEDGVENVFTSVPKTLMELPQIKIVEEPETEIISAISDDQYSEEIKDEISLLETMGEIGPDFDLESAIARLEFLIDNLDKSNVLFATVGQIKDKLVLIRSTSKSSKRESLQIMNAFHEDRNRYDGEAPAQDVVRLFFEDMRDIMKADMDMRTGKSLARDRSEEREMPAFLGEVEHLLNIRPSEKECAASDKEKSISSEIENCNASEEISSLSDESDSRLSVGDDERLSKKAGSSKTGTDDDDGGSSVGKSSNNGDTVDRSKKSDGRRFSLSTVHALESESRVSCSDEEIPIDSVPDSTWSSYCYGIFIESPYNFITRKKVEPDAEESEKSLHENPNDAEASSESSEAEDSPLKYYTYGWIVKNWYYYLYS